MKFWAEAMSSKSVFIHLLGVDREIRPRKQCWGGRLAGEWTWLRLRIHTAVLLFDPCRKQPSALRLWPLISGASSPKADMATQTRPHSAGRPPSRTAKELKGPWAKRTEFIFKTLQSDKIAFLRWRRKEKGSEKLECFSHSFRSIEVWKLGWVCLMLFTLKVTIGLSWPRTNPAYSFCPSIMNNSVPFYSQK